MFGIALARLDQVNASEKERYQALYCGLCFAIKERYGQISRLALSFDLAFLIMLYDSLYEPKEICGYSRCITHPKKKMPYAISEFSDYAADLSIMLAYNKCLDDINDDSSIKGRAGEISLRRAYEAAKRKLPEHAYVIESAMREISEIESRDDLPDEAAKIFGLLLGFLIECAPNVYPDFWSETLREFGVALGEFVYLMDAAVDLREDIKRKSYNPFANLGYLPDSDEDIEAMRLILARIASKVANTFERLPLVQDAHLLQSVMYSGLWQKFNREYEKQRHTPSSKSST